MKGFSSLLTMAIVAIVSTAQAQYANDAVRFSQTDYGTTSRFKAMGGAQIGVGGDLTSLGGNPAGLGLFTKSEFNFTPGLFGKTNKVSYLGQTTKNATSDPDISQAAAALYLPMFRKKGTDPSKGLVSLVVGLGYNKVADFRNEFGYLGVNAKNSIADYFGELGGSTLPANLGSSTLEGWAFQNYLISYDNAGYYYPETYVPANQSSNEIRKGGTSELNFAVALNISNQLYIGANLNILSLQYNRDASFSESGMAREYNISGVLTGNRTPYRLNFNQNQSTTGDGVNGRIGIIFRPVSQFRFGATIQTPTWYEIQDDYTEALDNRATKNGTNNKKTYNFTYRFRTPLKGSLGASYVIGTSALISADVDYVDYSTTKFSTSYSSNATTIAKNNTTIRTNYTNAINFRFGGEYKLDNVSLRGGFAYNGSPYKNKSNLDTKIYSAGVGYRINNFYIDGAYQYQQSESSYSPYTLADFSEPVANISSTRNNFFVTAGFRF